MKSALRFVLSWYSGGFGSNPGAESHAGCMFARGGPLHWKGAPSNSQREAGGVGMVAVRKTMRFGGLNRET